jgi:hypothetical protein
MAAIGGSIEEVSIRGRLFAVASDADVTLKLGGFNGETQPNGNGTARLVKTRVVWSLDGIAVEVDHSRADLEFLQEIANSNEFHPVSITLASGVTYQGTGTITGEIAASTQNATVGLALSGPGELTQQ